MVYFHYLFYNNLTMESWPSIFLGSQANDGTGDPPRTAGAKINNNFDRAFKKPETVSEDFILTTELSWQYIEANADSAIECLIPMWDPDEFPFEKGATFILRRNNVGDVILSAVDGVSLHGDRVCHGTNGTLMVRCTDLNVWHAILISPMPVIQIPNVTLAVDNWVKNGDFYANEVSINWLQTDHIAEVIPTIPDLNTLNVLAAAVIRSDTLITQGKLTVYAVNAPSTNMSVTLNISKKA
jgi:hypothetical protein